MLTGDFYARYPGLNPAVWKPLMFPPSSVGFESESSESQATVRVVPDVLPVEAVLPAATRRRRNPDFILPGAQPREDGGAEFPEQGRAGASVEQLCKASEMYRLGLRSKARRQASCAVYGRRRACENGHEFFERYYCRNRYCPHPGCGTRLFFDLFDKYLGLDTVAASLVPSWENRPHRKPRAGEFVMAKIDITIRNTGEMPTRAEVRQFNRDIRKLFRLAEREFDFTFPKRARQDRKMVRERDPRPGDYGVLWVDEFGGRATRPDRVGNTNLHAHGVYCGPYLPHDWLVKKWAEIRGDGSRRVSIKVARSFRGGLYHALKYAGKFLTHDPVRLAELELAFDRIRRVHAMGAFYNAVPVEVEKTESVSPRCPSCGGVMFNPTGPLCSVQSLELTGASDFEAANREASRARVFLGVSDG